MVTQLLPFSSTSCWIRDGIGDNVELDAIVELIGIEIFEDTLLVADLEVLLLPKTSLCRIPPFNALLVGEHVCRDTEVAVEVEFLTTFWLF